MHHAPKSYRTPQRDITSCDEGNKRKAVGYIRVSTDMQAADGLSLDAQLRPLSSTAPHRDSGSSESART